MNLFFGLPIFLGLTVVAQGVLNRRIGSEWGLSAAVLLNAIVFLVVSAALFFSAKFFPDLLPDYLKLQSIDTTKIKWWFAIPGLCGFFLVLGVPWSIQINGASRTFILLIASQIILSLLYERFILEVPMSNLKYLGAFIAAVGAALFALA